MKQKIDWSIVFDMIKDTMYYVIPVIVFVVLALLWPDVMLNIIALLVCAAVLYAFLLRPAITLAITNYHHRVDLKSRKNTNHENV